MRIYVDTNVYLDYFLDRRRFSESLRLFMDAIRCKHEIVLSDHVVHELNKFVELENIMMLFKLLEKKLVKVSSTSEDRDNTIYVDTHYSDALHIMLARRAGAEAIVTRNISDFPSFKTYRPEDL